MLLFESINRLDEKLRSEPDTRSDRYSYPISNERPRKSYLESFFFSKFKLPTVETVTLFLIRYFN